jgi:hypothetical protein
MVQKLNQADAFSHPTAAQYLLLGLPSPSTPNPRPRIANVNGHHT